MNSSEEAPSSDCVWAVLHYSAFPWKTRSLRSWRWCSCLKIIWTFSNVFYVCVVRRGKWHIYHTRFTRNPVVCTILGSLGGHGLCFPVNWLSAWFRLPFQDLKVGSIESILLSKFLSFSTEMVLIDNGFTSWVILSSLGTPAISQLVTWAEEGLPYRLPLLF